ncbi:MAG: alanine racemase [Clostridia bacterium]|nr:alanine racemase [Clostridia bacterium]
MNIGVCNSYLQVDLDALANNVRIIRRHIGPNVDIMPILKGNAYGMGLYDIASFLTEKCGVTIIGNAQTAEALQLKEAGIRSEFVIIGGVPFHNIPAVVEHDFITPAYHREYLLLLNEEAARRGKRARVHIKIETGLNRIGVWPGEDLHKLLDLLNASKHLEVTGAYTHFAEAEAVDKSFSMEQFTAFKSALRQIRGEGFKLQYVHAFNTAATVWLKDEEITHVRPAGLIFGFDVNDEPRNALGLTEVLTWRAFVTNVKTVPAGETVGYNRAFIAEKPTRVATVSAGYGDGYPRHLAAFCGAEMLVRGRRAKVIGTCMDQTFLDVSCIDVEINDAVTIIGRDGGEFISVFELQERMGQTYLAVVATMAQRVKRIYIGGEKG